MVDGSLAFAWVGVAIDIQVVVGVRGMDSFPVKDGYFFIHR